MQRPPAKGGAVKASTKAVSSPKGARAGSAAKSRPSSAASSAAKKGAQGAIGAYTKLRAVGKGSFGQIWLVRHTQKGGEPIVLKEVHIKKLSANEVKAAKLEIEVLKKMSHANIIAFVGTFEVDGITGLLMEHAAAGDLGTAIAKRIKDGRVRFPESEVRTLILQLASALGHLHDVAKIIHRDVKPANVFMSAGGDVKLGDFGLCAHLDAQLSSEPVGTPVYMAPELLAGKPYDKGADVWAFGCTVWEAMSLASPWSELEDGYGGLEGGMAGLLKCVQTRTLDTDSLKVEKGGNYPTALCDATAKLLARAPEKRLPLHKLVELLHEKPAIPASWGLSAEAAAALAIS